MLVGGLLIFALIAVPLSYWIAALILRRRKQPVSCPWPTADYCPRTVALLNGVEEMVAVRPKTLGGASCIGGQPPEQMITIARRHKGASK